MTTYNATVQTTDDSVLAILVVDGNIHSTTEDNPKIDQIVALIRKGLDAKAKKKGSAAFFAEALPLFNMESAVAATFEQLTERIAVKGGHVYFDGEVLDETIENLIVRSLEARTADYLPIVNFLEKVYTNTEKHTRDNLLTWLRAEDFSITTTGDIVAYKGLRADFTSIHAGPATVDGVDVKGHVANNVGSVVEIKRSDVVANPMIGCAYGLHAGTYEYANGFAQGALVEVHVNPRDVVSVPTDCNAQKMRVARYKVIQQITSKHTATVVDGVDDDFGIEVL